MSDQKDAGADDKNTIAAEEVEFALSADDVLQYLEHVRPSGYPCPVCHNSTWWPALNNDDQGDNKAYPTTLTPEQHQSLTPLECMLLGVRGEYKLYCSNCGHVISFNAGLLAGRLALWKKAEGNA